MGKYLDGNGLSHIFSLIKSFFVQKAGDTMTGDLRVSNSDITKDVVPSSDIYKSNLIVSDANDDQIGYFGALQQTSSKEGIQFGTSRAVNGSTVYHGCHVTINSSGSRSVYFDDAAAWRSGLGVPATSSTAQLSAANTFTNTATYKSSTLDRDRASTLSTEASSNSYLKFTDKDNESIGYIKHREGTDGKMSMDIFMETETSSHVKTSNGLTMSVDKSGNRSISVTDPAGWRSALGLNAWTTVTIGNFATAASGWSFSTNNCNVQYNEALGALRVRIQIQTSAAQTAGQKTLFTVKAAYRPKTFAAPVPSLTSYAQAGQIYTSGGFAVNISAISANTSLYFNGVYFIGA